jgi:hypothetical protein
MANSDHFGYVYFDPVFKFKDGKVGEKRFVVLCSSPMIESEVVVVRTTSQERGSRDYGRQLDGLYQNFYLPMESEVFQKDTWIMLDYAIEYSVSALGTSAAARKKKLGPRSFKDLLDCAAQATDIEQDIRAAISELTATI